MSASNNQKRQKRTTRAALGAVARGVPPQARNAPDGPRGEARTHAPYLHEEVVTQVRVECLVGLERDV